MAKPDLPKRIVVWSLVVTSLALSAAGVLVFTNQARRSHIPEEAWSAGQDYVVVEEVFRPGYRHAGHVVGGLTVPDRIVVVPGSDVNRILAGKEPLEVYESFTPAHWTTVSFIGPDFRCTQTNGGCQPGDAPALVVMKGTAWHGIQRGQLERDQFAPERPSISLHHADAFVAPTLTFLGFTGMAGILVTIVAGIWWLASGGARRRSPGQLAPAHASAEEGLLVMELAEMYAAGIVRSRVVTGIALLVGGVLMQVLLLPYLVDEVVEGHFPLGPEWVDITVDLAFWWWIPVLAVVAGTAWLLHWRDSRVALGQWRHVRHQMMDARQTLLEG